MMTLTPGGTRPPTCPAQRWSYPVTDTDDLPEVYPHPLFPAEAGEQPPHVVFITVRRLGPEGWTTYPGRILAAELLSEQQVWDAWGGGKYTLVGHSRTGIASNASFALEGPRKPLMPVTEQPSDAPRAPAAAAPNGDVGPKLQFLFGELAAQRQEAIQMRASADAQTRAHIEAMAQMYSQSQQTLVALLTRREEHADPLENVLKTAEMLNELRAGAMEGVTGSGEDELDSIKKGVDIVQSLTDKKSPAKAPEVDHEPETE
jgi:hypothetical protein